MVSVMEPGFPTASITVNPPSSDRVLISIDNTALLHSSGEPLRAQSLNRLDNVHEGAQENPGGCQGDPQAAIYKCPSFPRLPGRITPEARTFSGTTHADSDSISPRVSTDNLTTHDWDKDRLSLGCPVTLTRSVSARTVDNLPPLDLSIHTVKGAMDTSVSKQANQFLSPHMTGDGQTSLVSRSTSCPSMAYRRSPSASPLSPESPQARRHAGVTNAAYTPGDGNANISQACRLSEDVNLEGEVIRDLPVEPSPAQVFPDFVQPAGQDKRSQDVGEKSSAAVRYNGEVRQRSAGCSNRRDKARSAFVNIGDIPSTIAQKVISEQHGLAGLPQTDRNVKAKCLQWLNSIDQDTDNEGDGC